MAQIRAISEDCELKERGLMSYSKQHDEHLAENLSCFYSIVYVSSYLGEIEVATCNDCGYEDILCVHSVNQWDTEGKHLICQVCGSDGA